MIYNSKKGLLGIVVLVITAVIFSVDTLAQTSYPMVCRGGGNMRANYTASVTQGKLDITFTKSTSSSTKRQPNSGECAWLDRPISQTEPNHMVFRVVGKSQEPFTEFEVTPTKINIKRLHKDFLYLINAIQQGSIFYVHCRSKEFGYLEITRVGP
jgi:hypothetical protein